MPLAKVGRFFYWQYHSKIFWFSSHILYWVLEVFYWLILYLVFLLSLPSLGWEVFHQRHDLLRLISFPTGLGCSHWSPGFPPQFPIIGLGGFSPGSHSSSPSTISRSAELASEEGGNCNNVTFGAESSRSRSHVTTTNHDFTSSGLTSITALGSSSSTPLSRRRSVPPHLRHWVGGTSIYKSEGYSVATDAYQVWYKMTKESRRVMTKT